MKRIAFVISLLSVSCTMALAQQNYFVFIQSDKQQPFYIRFHEKTYSSSAIGHLVLPKLGDSTYHLSIGFPRNAYPERDYTLPINRQDHAFQLTWKGEQGWVLQDDLTMATIQPAQGVTAGNSLGLGERKTGEFATLMASLVNDTTVMYKTLVKAETPKSAPVAAKADTAIALKEPETRIDTAIAMAIAPIKTDTAKQVQEVVVTTRVDSAKTDTAKVIVAQPAPTPDTAVAMAVDSAVRKPAVDSQAVTKVAVPEAKASIVQVQEHSGETTKELVFVDSSAAGVDTIPVLIALEKQPVKPVAKPDTMVAAANKVETADTKPNKSDKPDSTATATTVTPAVDNSVAVKNDSAAAKPKALVLFNSDCVNFATEQDVDKLRVKMLAANSVDDKIGAAKKIFKTKCFVTRYIKGLSELFPSDETRFKFFEAAYPFVSDTSSFRELVDLLSSELYIARFKAMVRM